MKKRRYYFYDGNEEEILSEDGKHLYVVAFDVVEAYERAVKSEGHKSTGVTVVSPKKILTQSQINRRSLKKRKDEDSIVNKTVRMHEKAEKEIKRFDKLDLQSRWLE